MKALRIDHDALKNIEDEVLKQLEKWDPLRQKIAYQVMYNWGFRMERIPREINELSPRKEVKI